MSKIPTHGGVRPLPEEMFEHAVGFELSGRILRGFCSQPGQSQALPGVHPLPPGGIRSSMVSDTVVEAFALEVYLKCLLVLLGITPPRTHSIVELFAALPETAQMKIRSDYDAYLRSHPGVVEVWKKHGQPSDFDSMIAENDHAFEEWRYAYEDWPYTDPSSATKNWMPVPILGLVRREILARKPEWTHYAEHLEGVVRYPGLPEGPI